MKTPQRGVCEEHAPHALIPFRFVVKGFMHSGFSDILRGKQKVLCSANPCRRTEMKYS